MGKILVVGVGGVFYVVVYKMVMNSDIFFEIMLVSWMKFKCDVIVVLVKECIGVMIKIVVLDVMDVVVIVVLIKEMGVEIFVNFVLFY